MIPFMVKQLIKSLLFLQEWFIQEQLWGHSFVATEDIEIALLLLYFQFIPLDVSVRYEEFVGFVEGRVLWIWSCDNIFIKCYILFLDMFIQHVTLAENGVPDDQILIFIWHPLSPIIDISIYILDDLSKRIQPFFMILCHVIWLIFNLLSLF